MRKLKFLLTCLLMVSISLVSAQTKTASGTVTSADNGEPVIGASVLIKGTSQGTITNVNGKFTLTVPANATLVISSIGLISQEAAPGTNMEIVLLTDTKTLDEVVVTALGIQRQKRDLGYSIANINSEELTQAKSVSVATGLQGKVAGLNIASLNNGVFEDVKINLRGIRSLTGNNNPMLLLD